MYIILIVISFVGLGIAIKYLKNNEIPIERLDKIIELSKYTIVTIAIATITSIVTDLYKERDQDVKELEYFDKYVNDIKLADNVVVRYQLAKYLSCVAPKGDMHDSWKNYFDTVNTEYQIYINDLVTKKREKADSENKLSIPPTEKKQIEDLKREFRIQQSQSPIAAVDADITPRVYLQIADEKQRPVVEIFAKELRNQNYIAPGIENVGKRGVKIPQQTEVRYSFKEDEGIANDVIKLLSIQGFNPKIKPSFNKPSAGDRPKHIEIWFSNSK
jgi:hypothetical protein